LLTFGIGAWHDPGMPALHSPTVWLATAATAISAVTVAAMVGSGGPRRPLTFAGAILLPDGNYSAASPAAGTTAQPSRSSTAARMSTAASVRVSPTEYQPPVAAVTAVQNTPAARNTPAAQNTSAAQNTLAVRNTPAAQASSNTPAQVATPSSASAVRTPASTSSRPVDNPPTGVPTTPASSPSATALAQALFSTLNDARRQAGLTSLSWNPGLQRSAAGHDLAMAAANQLASQVGDEPELKVRQANQGVVASFSAESLGYAESTELAGAIAVQQQMLAELPPDDSRRQTLLSTAVNAIGIDVLLDPAHGRVWVTEDFAQLS
jgi:uncharacterized protein YkwD